MTHTTKFGLKSLLEYFRFNTMFVAPLGISSFGIFFCCIGCNGPLFLSSTNPVKFLIVITLVVQEIYFVFQEYLIQLYSNSGEW